MNFISKMQWNLIALSTPAFKLTSTLVQALLTMKTNEIKNISKHFVWRAFLFNGCL